MIVPRETYLERLSRFQDKSVIKVLTGLRRSGKSSLLRLKMERLKTARVPAKCILFIDKESLEFDDIRTYQDLDRWVKTKWKGVAGKKYLFVDEIQEIESWEKAIASMLGQKLADIYITGSNAHLLSSELATLLSGRYVEIPVHPLTFREFRDFHRQRNSRAIEKRSGSLKSPPNLSTVEDDFKLFLKYGGLPGIHEFDLIDGMTVFQYLSSVFHTILYKDITLRHRIRDAAMLDRIARFSFDNCGNMTSAQRIAEYFKSQRLGVSTDTVLNYLGYLESAFLLRRARRFDIKGKRHLEVNDKFYMGDVGLRHGFIGYRDSDIGGLLENVVFLELLHRGYAVSVGKWGDKEIDFVAEKENERLYIQVCYLLAGAETEKREFAPLLDIQDNHPKFVLSMDKDWGEGRSGIRRLYLPNFLMG
jgi:uncharacterized protein